MSKLYDVLHQVVSLTLIVSLAVLPRHLYIVQYAACSRIRRNGGQRRNDSFEILLLCLHWIRSVVHCPRIPVHRAQLLHLGLLDCS